MTETESGRQTLSDFSYFEMTNFGISDRIAFNRIQINHYQCKTFPEFRARMRNGSVGFPYDNPNHALDESWGRFQKLDIDADLERSIRRFDAAVDESLARIKTIRAQGKTKRLSP